MAHHTSCRLNNPLPLDNHHRHAMVKMPCPFCTHTVDSLILVFRGHAFLHLLLHCSGNSPQQGSSPLSPNMPLNRPRPNDANPVNRHLHIIISSTVRAFEGASAGMIHISISYVTSDHDEAHLYRFIQRSIFARYRTTANVAQLPRLPRLTTPRQPV